MTYKQSSEHRANLSKSLKIAMNRPEVIAARLGRPCSPETRAKIGATNSRNMKGKKLSSEHKQKMIAGIRKAWERNKADPEFMAKRREKLSKALKGRYTGDKASNWRGGDTQYARRSMVHKDWRNAILLRDDYTCQACLERGGILHVDHIKEWSKYPELRFELDNGRTICRACHYFLHFRKKIPKSSGWGLPKKQVGILDLS